MAWDLYSIFGSEIVKSICHTCGFTEEHERFHQCPNCESVDIYSSGNLVID